MRLSVLFSHEFCIAKFRQGITFAMKQTVAVCFYCVASISHCYVCAVTSFFGSWRACYMSISKCFVQLDTLSVSVALYQCFCILGMCQRASSLFYSIVCSRNIMCYFAVCALAIVWLPFLTDTCPYYVSRLIRVLHLSPPPWCYHFCRSSHP